jgi:SET domain-containing protein
MIKIKQTKKYGRGLFASEDIPINTIVEVSELIVIPDAKEDKQLLKTRLKHYLYLFEEGSALALGVGSLFNHNPDPNVVWKMNIRRKKIIFKTKRPIRKGEQLFINYGYDV